MDSHLLDARMVGILTHLRQSSVYEKMKAGLDGCGVSLLVYLPLLQVPATKVEAGLTQIWSWKDSVNLSKA